MSDQNADQSTASKTVAEYAAADADIAYAAYVTAQAAAVAVREFAAAHPLGRGTR
ncbi:MAG: hypothetical protein ACREQA_19575 [Candidatus Binatia bacterium]